MAPVRLVGCAALVWVAAFVLLFHGGDRREAFLRERMALRMERACLTLIELLASGELVTRLLGRNSVRSVCDAVADAAARRGRTWVTRAHACAALILAVCVTALGAALSSRSVLGALSIVVACVVGVPMWAATRQKRLEQELAAEMPGVFRSLAMALGAGETLSQAIEYVGTHEEGPAGQAFMRAALSMRCGVSAHEALGTLSEDLDAPGVGLMVTALLISQRTGSPLRGLFEYSAALVDRAREFERMLVVKTAQVRLSVRIVCLLPLAMLLGLSLISPDFQRGLATVPGIASVSVAACMDVVALVIIRRIIHGVL